MVEEVEEEEVAVEAVVEESEGERMEAWEKGVTDISLSCPASDSSLVYTKHNFDFVVVWVSLWWITNLYFLRKYMLVQQGEGMKQLVPIRHLVRD